MAEYYTYKSQVPLKTGEKLGFTAGRGYYAIPAPAPAKTSAPAKQASTEELGGLTATQAEQVAKSYGLTTTGSGQGSETSTKTSSTDSTSKPPTKHTTQPSKAPTTAAKTPAAAEAAAKSRTDAYRPTVFKTSTKAKPNAALIEAAHRQGGTVAHPTPAAKTTKPATANMKKHQTTIAKTTIATGAKKLVQTTASAAKHPAQAATPTYQTYKKDVHLKPGQTLAYTLGKGYYARPAAPTVELGVDKGSRQEQMTSPTRPASRVAPSLSVVANRRLTVKLNGKTYVNKSVTLSVNRRDQLTVKIGNTHVVIKPTATELKNVEKLQKTSVAGGKIAYPLLTVMAAKIADVPLALVCAVMQRESYEGKNVWGK